MRKILCALLFSIASTGSWANNPSDTYSITDASPAIVAGTYDANSIVYTRSGSAVASGKYGSFCMPFDIDLSSVNCFEKVYCPVQTAFYNISTGLMSIFFKSVEMTSTILAGTPFLALINGNAVSLSNSSSVTFDASPVNPATTLMTVFDIDGTIVSGVLFEDTDISMELGGTYSKTTPPAGKTMFSFKTNGNFGYQTSDLTPFRAYLLKTDNNNNAKAVDVQLVLCDDESTGIEQLMSEADAVHEVKAKVYSIDGRLIGSGSSVLNGLSKGVYIINGKKICK